MRTLVTRDELTTDRQVECDRDVSAYQEYCSAQNSPQWQHASFWEHIEDLAPTLTPTPFRCRINNLRRVFVDRDADDPFWERGAVMRYKKLLERCRQPAQFGVYGLDIVTRVLESLPNTLAGMRDAAQLGLVFAGRLTGRDLEALDAEHITVSEAGLEVELITSTRPPVRLARLPSYAEGARVNACVTAAVERWLEAIEYRGPFCRCCFRSVVHERTQSYRGIVCSLGRRLTFLGLHGSLLSFKNTAIPLGITRGASEDDIRAQGDIRTQATIDRWKQRAGLRPNSMTQRLGF